MKTHGIGRNDPCPCGSGKKFKHCCLGKESSTASGHGAAGISETLRSALEGLQFNSPEEAQAFLNQITQQQNHRQLDEFTEKDRFRLPAKTSRLCPALYRKW